MAKIGDLFRARQSPAERAPRAPARVPRGPPWLGRAGKILRFEDAKNEICNEFGPSFRPFHTAWHTGFARRASQVNQDCVSLSRCMCV